MASSRNEEYDKIISEKVGPISAEDIEITDEWYTQRENELLTEKYLKRLTNLPKKVKKTPGQGFVSLIYVLSDPPIDGEYGQLFPMKSHSTYDDAEKYVRKIINKTGVKSVRIYPMCEWRAITNKTNPNMVKYTSNDGTKIESLEEKHNKAELENLQEEIKVKKEIEDERLKSTIPHTMDHYIYSWYRAILQKSLIEHHKEELNKALRKFELEKDAILDDYNSNREFDEKWLPLLEERLNRRKEHILYSSIVKGYMELRDDVLPDDRKEVVIPTKNE